MIRPATVADIPRIVEMGRQFIADTSYRGGIADNPDRLARTAARLIEGDDSALFVADTGAAVVGMIGVYTYTHPYSDELFATELFWWMDPEHRGAGLRLLKHAEAWARWRGATALQVVAPRSNDRLGVLYERLGFTRVETHYQRDLCPQASAQRSSSAA